MWMTTGRLEEKVKASQATNVLGLAQHCLVLLSTCHSAAAYTTAGRECLLLCVRSLRSLGKTHAGLWLRSSGLGPKHTQHDAWSNPRATASGPWLHESSSNSTEYAGARHSFPADLPTDQRARHTSHLITPQDLSMTTPFPFTADLPTNAPGTCHTLPHHRTCPALRMRHHT